MVAPHVNEDGSTSLWISLADRPDWPVYVQAEDCTWELGVEAWTAKITIVNTNEVPLLLNITPQDESLGGGAESQPQELTPYEYFNFTNIPPGVYLFSFSFNAGQPIELSCRIRFLDYSHVLFVVVPEGIAVVEENFEPQSSKTWTCALPPCVKIEMNRKKLAFPTLVLLLSILACTSVNVVNNSSNRAIVQGSVVGDSGVKVIPPGGTGVWVALAATDGYRIYVLPDQQYIDELDTMRIETSQLLDLANLTGQADTVELLALKTKLFALEFRINQLKQGAANCSIYDPEANSVTIVIDYDILSGRWFCAQ